LTQDNYSRSQGEADNRVCHFSGLEQTGLPVPLFPGLKPMNWVYYRLHREEYTGRNLKAATGSE
jgi:hypothetical protein